MSGYKDPTKGKWKNHYSYAYKREVLESIENGKLSQTQASKKFGVSQRSIARWLEKYGNFEKKLKEMGGKSPRQEISDLRAKLRSSKAENEVLKAIVAILEEEYGEDVIKKYLPESLDKTIPRRKKE